MADVTLQVGTVKDVSLSLTAVSGQETLANLWLNSSDTRKNTFVDANAVELAKFLFSDTARTSLDFYTGLVLGEVLALGTFFDSQINSGNWALLDDWGHLGLQTESNSLIKAISGGSMTAVNAPTHTPGTGIAFNGSTQYLSDVFNPTSDGVNYTLDDALAGVFLVTVANDSSKPLGVVDTGVIQINDINTTASLTINSLGTSTTFPELSNNDLVIASRVVSTTQKAFINGAEAGSGSIASTVLPNRSLYLGARNNAGSADSFWSGTISSFIAGASIGFDHTNYNDNLVYLNLALSQI